MGNRLAWIMMACVACRLLVAAPAHADDRALAREHFQRGSKLFDLGHFDDAIKEYEAAYQLRDDPVLLYNLGQANRHAGHTREALHFYRAYLAREPHAPNRDEVNAKIAELQRLIDQQQRTQSMPPDGPLLPAEHGRPEPPAPAAGSTSGASIAASSAGATEPAPKPAETAHPTSSTTTSTTSAPTTSPTTAMTSPAPASAGSPTAPDAPPVATSARAEAHKPGRTLVLSGAVVGGAGVALLVGGIVAAVLAKSASDSVTEAGQNREAFDPSLEASGKSNQLAAGVLFGVGAAAAATGTVLLILGVRKNERAARAQLVPILGPTQAGASLRTSF